MRWPTSSSWPNTPADNGTARTSVGSEVALAHRREPLGHSSRNASMSSNSWSRIGTWPSAPASMSTPADDAVAGDRHHQVAAHAGRAVQQQHAGPALDRVAGREGQHGLLVRLLERDVDEPDAVAQQAVRRRRCGAPRGSRRRSAGSAGGRVPPTVASVDGFDGCGAHRAISLSVRASVTSGMSSGGRRAGAAPRPRRPAEEGADQQHADDGGQRGRSHRRAAAG